MFDFKLINDLKISLFGSFIIHANIVETLTDDEQIIYALADENVYSTDGSVYTHPFFYNKIDNSSGYIETARDYMNYLTQAHKMFVFQLGFNSFIGVFASLNASSQLDEVRDYLGNIPHPLSEFEGKDLTKIKWFIGREHNPQEIIVDLKVNNKYNVYAKKGIKLQLL